MAKHGIDLGGLLRTLVSDYQQTRVKREKRYTEGIGILEGVVEQFGPGYLKGEEKKTLASMEQGMVGRGLGGTTRPAAEGTGIKADIRDRQTRARTGAMTNVAQFMANFQDVSPDPSTLAHLATGGFSGLLQEQLARAQGGPLGEPFRGFTVDYGDRDGGGGFGGGAGGGGGGVSGGGGGYVPQVGDYMSVAGGPGGAIMSGGGAGWAEQAAVAGAAFLDDPTFLEQLGGGGGAVGGGWQIPQTMSAGPGFTYTWIGGPDGHYTISSTPGSTGEDVGMDAIRATSTGDLGAVSDPGSTVSRATLGGYGGGF